MIPLPEPIWSGRSELIQRLLAQTCELCGATENIEVHHVRKLADLERAGQPAKLDWQKAMAIRQRKFSNSPRTPVSLTALA